jgi:hypothetical protein
MLSALTPSAILSKSKLHKTTFFVSCDVVFKLAIVCAMACESAGDDVWPYLFI